MRFVEIAIERDDIPKEWLAELGGAFSFWEGIKLGGTGSPPLQFHSSSIPEIDQAIFKSSSESFPIVFQRMKQGLIFRCNWRTKLFWGSIPAMEIISGNILPHTGSALLIELKTPSGNLILRFHRDRKKAVIKFFNRELSFFGKEV